METDFGCNLNNRGGLVGVKIKGINDVANFTLVLSR